MTARAFFTIPQAVLQVLFICSIFKICDLQGFLRNGAGGTEEGGKFVHFQMSSLPPQPLSDLPGWLCRFAAQVLCGFAAG